MPTIPCRHLLCHQGFKPSSSRNQAAYHSPTLAGLGVWAGVSPVSLVMADFLEDRQGLFLVMVDFLGDWQGCGYR